MTPTIRHLYEDDCDEYIKLIGQLTDIGHVTQSQYVDFIKGQTENNFTLVLTIGSKVVGCLTILIEQKIAHSFGRVMHIEDVVTDKDYRGRGVATTLLDEAIRISKEKKCYKVILDCNQSNVNFYKQMGFVQGQFQMLYRNL